MAFALVEESGRVVQVAPTMIFEVAFPLRWVECGNDVQAEWRLDGNVWVAAPAIPAPPVPVVVTMRQARLALLDAGLLDAVTTAIAALPLPQREAAQIEWDYAATVERASPIVEMLAAAVPLNGAELDALFTTAAAR